MTLPVGNNKEVNYFTMEQMRSLISIMGEKKDKPIFKGDFVDIADKGEKEKQDVIIMKPLSKKSGNGENIPSNKELNAFSKNDIQIEEVLAGLPAVVAKVDPKVVEDLKSEGYLVYDNRPRGIFPGIPRTLTTDNFQMPKVNPVEMTETDHIHSLGFTGKNQVIAVIDSGFFHPKTTLVAWKDMVSNNPNPNDPVGHGTHVAGDTLQLAPDAKIVAVRVMNDEGQGRPSDIIKGINWAVENKDKYGIGIINLSLGGGPDGLPYTVDPVNKAVESAIKKGIVVVAAAGNSGPEKATLGSPADTPTALTVGSALDKKTVSKFSSRGPTDDGLNKPDVMAPGEFIVSWNVEGSVLDQTATIVEKLRNMSPGQLRKLLTENPQFIEMFNLPSDILSKPDAQMEKMFKSALPPVYLPDKEHLAGPGTSFAAPEVAGIVANLKQSNPNMTPAQIKEVLMKTAEDMGEEFKENDEGAGFINAQKAIEKTK